MKMKMKKRGRTKETKSKDILKVAGGKSRSVLADAGSRPMHLLMEWMVLRRFAGT